jgi:hypothetical protein
MSNETPRRVGPEGDPVVDDAIRIRNVFYIVPRSMASVADSIERSGFAAL